MSKQRGIQTNLLGRKVQVIRHEGSPGGEIVGVFLDCDRDPIYLINVKGEIKDVYASAFRLVDECPNCGGPFDAETGCHVDPGGPCRTFQDPDRSSTYDHEGL